MADDWFSGFGGQSARSGGSYFAPGTYIVRLEALVRRVSQNAETRGHQLAIAEFTIHEVEVAYEADPGSGAPNDGWAPSNKLGERVAYINNTTKHGETAYSNVKGLLLAALQTEKPDFAEGAYTPDQWRQALLKATEPPGTLLAGRYLRARVTKTRTRRGTPFTPVVFEPVSQADYLAA